MVLHTNEVNIHSQGWYSYELIMNLNYKRKVMKKLFNCPKTWGNRPPTQYRCLFIAQFSNDFDKGACTHMPPGTLPRSYAYAEQINGSGAFNPFNLLV